MAQQWTEADVEWLATEGLRLAADAEQTNELPKNRETVRAWLTQVEAWLEAGHTAQHRAAIDGASDRPRGYFIGRRHTTMTGDVFVKDVRATVTAIRESAAVFQFSPQETVEGRAPAKTQTLRREILERLYRLGEESPGASGLWDADRADPDRMHRAQEAEYLRDQGLLVGTIGADGGLSLRLTPKGRDYVEAGGFWQTTTAEPNPTVPTSSKDLHQASVPLGGSLGPSPTSEGPPVGRGLPAGLAMPLGGPGSEQKAEEERLREEEETEAQEEEDESARVWKAWNQQKSSTSGAIPSDPGPSTSPPPMPNSPYAFTRDTHPQEHCLGVDDYARALSAVMNAAIGEFCLAVYGHWGRGKTFLMQRLSSVLPGRYRPVWFSAWKYRTTPEIWIHLYETIATASRRDGFWYSTPRAVRAYMSKNGVWPIILLLLSLSITTFGLGLVPVLIGILGLIGLLKAYAVSRWVAKVPRALFSLPQHRDKLGLQAAIADDLTALLQGWIRPRKKPQKANEPPPKKGREAAPRGTVPTDDTSQKNPSGQELSWVWFVLYLLAVALFAVTLGFVLQGQEHGPIPIHPPDEVRIALVAIVAAVGAALPIWIVCGGGNAVERIALIVDDLDRCDPPTMLELVESLKLLLEDPEVSTRVQVVMLVEEQALHHAIAERYSHRTAGDAEREQSPARLIPPRKAASPDDPSVCDTVEKLFVAHLRLPELRTFELEDVMKSYLEQPGLRSKLTAEQRARVLKEHQDAEAADRARRRELRRQAGELVVEPVETPDAERAKSSSGGTKSPEAVQAAALESTDPSELVFSYEERQQLLKAVHLLVKSAKGRALGPRALRAFLTRYQFAKFLLATRKATCSPRDLVQALVERPSTSTGDPDLDAVVAEVS